jgi:predicted  nucleic acid-binding Zn-ribbon protein
VARPTLEWFLEYQGRIEAARRDYLLLKEQGEAKESVEGQGGIEMTEVNSELVQIQLLELEQQIIHVIEACNEVKDVLEEEFDSVRNGIPIMESRLQTEKIRIESEVFGVGTMANVQDAMLPELCSGIHVLQSQANQIVSEATDLFNRMRQELEALSKRISDNTLQISAVKVSTESVQKGVSILSTRIDEVIKAMTAIMT